MVEGVMKATKMRTKIGNLNFVGVFKVNKKQK